VHMRARVLIKLLHEYQVVFAEKALQMKGSFSQS